MSKSSIDKFYILFAGASAILSIGYMYQNSLWLILLYTIIVNVITMKVYSDDKKASIRGHERTPEACFIFCNILGGWIGAIFAQQWFRHKTRKLSFQLSVIMSIMINMYIVYVKRDSIHLWNNIFEE